MRIIQIIDSLEAGGAERMAVNYANALAQQIDFSGLVSTRKEGPLLSQLDKSVDYLFLNKRNSLDLKAILRLRRFVIKHKVTLVHAHGTSFFIAFLLKLVCPSVKLIWHDHYGDSEFLNSRSTLTFRMTLPFFDGVIAVNQKLKIWAEQKINSRNSIYLLNFPSEEKEVEGYTFLKGVEGKRIVCLANLRLQKNHFLLLRVAKRLKVTHPDWTFHLVGKDFEDSYSAEIRRMIMEYGLADKVFIYGSKNDIKHVLHQASLGVLCSSSEGLPVALLEYGWAKKPVVVTDVGEIASVVKNRENGFLVSVHESIHFHKALVELMDNQILQKRFGKALHQTVEESYSENKVIKQYLTWIQKILK
jgi:glycosyltransferase involved in cell wall biosynthesis